MNDFNKNNRKRNVFLAPHVFGLMVALYCPSVISGGNLSANLECTTDVIMSKAGPICGKTVMTDTGKQSQAFLGIPYAESTEKEARWQPPVPKTSWSDVYRAFDFGSICPQNRDPKFDVAQSEDCLSLNVWTPEGIDSQSKKRAVMVFIHGGSFNSGAGSYPLYDGSYLAANRDVIIVNFNYRLGALGFLATDELSGNFGFMDQQLALGWVKNNISNFGGDPDKVTIFGESAGAMSIGLHVLSAPKSDPLFRAGLMQSNLIALPFPRLEQAKDVGNIFKWSLICSDIECLRKTDTQDILTAQNNFASSLPEIFSSSQFIIPFGPVIDGVLLTEQPINVALSKKRKKPILLGANKNEGILFTSSYKTITKYVSNIASLFGLNFEKILKIYPPQHESSNAITMAKVFDDAFFKCGARNVGLSQNGLTYLYSYDFSAPIQLWGPAIYKRDGYVLHGAELPFVFHTPEKINYQFTPTENQVSIKIMDYWTNFAKYLNPNGPGKPPSALTHWPAFEVPEKKYMVFNTLNSIQSDPNAEACEFWDSIGYNFSNPWMRAKE